MFCLKFVRLSCEQPSAWQLGPRTFASVFVKALNPASTERAGAAVFGGSWVRRPSDPPPARLAAFGRAVIVENGQSA